jgi:hypothetical protein
MPRHRATTSFTLGLSPSLRDQLVNEGAVPIRDVFADDRLGFSYGLPVATDVKLVPFRLQDHPVAGPHVKLGS